MQSNAGPVGCSRAKPRKGFSDRLEIRVYEMRPHDCRNRRGRALAPWGLCANIVHANLGVSALPPLVPKRLVQSLTERQGDVVDLLVLV
jgi:hypothetical protein